ncbi:DUF2637 domain-containing protein [Streptomyces sp. NPDC050485]|uniref:DUF2637 domain-containing protein n=1 Tax=Streptomyces sp. NPDC050485 TaxID=3365617 RepID=UPI0037898D48
MSAGKKVPLQLTRTHRILIGLVVAGAVVIAGIGFAGSYAAVRELALKKGFGNFSYVFPIGVDAGICVLLALDLLLTWMRIPFPLLRQTAWLLTAATIAFNGAAAWPDPLGVGMHAVIPVLFVVSVEAARHAVGRIADITADKHMEGVRVTRWLLSPVPTFLLWRRMKLWELRSYEQVIKLEQDRLVYRARLQSVYGRAWRRKAPVESLMPLRLAKFGVPLAETAPAGLAAAGMEPVLLPSVSIERTDLPLARREMDQEPDRTVDAGEVPASVSEHLFQQVAASRLESEPVGERHVPEEEREQAEDREQAAPASPWFAAQHVSPEVYEGTYDPAFTDAAPQPQPQPEQAHEREPVMVSVDPSHAQAANAETFGMGPDGADSNMELHRDTASVLEFQHSNAREFEGVAADRTGGSGRVSVQVRIPPAREELAESGTPSTDDGTTGPVADAVQEPVVEEEDVRAAAPADLKGIALVEFYYRALRPKEQAMSANSLAPMLAERTGYKVGTVRKYLGAIKKA